jgi:hypothetical protein
VQLEGLSKSGGGGRRKKERKKSKKKHAWPHRDSSPRPSGLYGYHHIPAVRLAVMTRRIINGMRKELSLTDLEIQKSSNWL